MDREQPQGLRMRFAVSILGAANTYQDDSCTFESWHSLGDAPVKFTELLWPYQQDSLKARPVDTENVLRRSHALGDS
jgi:hypothetical protein